MNNEESNIFFCIIFNLSEPTQSAILTSMKVGISPEKHGAQTVCADEAWSWRVLKIIQKKIFDSDTMTNLILLQRTTHQPPNQPQHQSSPKRRTKTIYFKSLHHSTHQIQHKRIDNESK